MRLMHSCASKLSKIICLMLLGNVMISMNETELNHLNVTLVIDLELN
jgi:hypothetical protein